jgi:hypothetical protein
MKPKKIVKVVMAQASQSQRKMMECGSPQKRPPCVVEDVVFTSPIPMVALTKTVQQQFVSPVA